MNATERLGFVRAQCARLADEIAGVNHLIPDEWDVAELKRYIADLAEGSVPGCMNNKNRYRDKKRIRKYENCCIVSGL